jgi:DNA sulfur modification protein DndE
MRSLSQKTGLSANVLSRFAMLLSFEDVAPPAVDAGKPGLTINRATLFGELEPFLMSAYTLRGQSPSKQNVSKDLANHIARGAGFLNVRVQSLPDLLAVVCDLP